MNSALTATDFPRMVTLPAKTLVALRRIIRNETHRTQVPFVVADFLDRRQIFATGVIYEPLVHQIYPARHEVQCVPLMRVIELREDGILSP